MKSITFIESVHTENVDKILKQRVNDNPYEVIQYEGQPASEWASVLFQKFYNSQVSEIVVVNGLHHAVVATKGQFHYVNHLVSGLFALGCGPMTLNIDYKSPKGDCLFNDDEIKYWLELTDTELLPINDYAVDLFLDKELPSAE